MSRHRFWSVFFAAAGLIVLYCLLQKLSVVGMALQCFLRWVSPILSGLVIAFVLNLPMRGLEKMWDKADGFLRRLFEKERKTDKKNDRREDGSEQEVPKRQKVQKQQGKISEALRRPVCLLASIVVILAILSAVVALVLPEIGKAVMLLINGVSDVLKKIQAWCLTYAEEYPVIEKFILEMNIDWETTAKSLLGIIGSGTLGVVGSTFRSVVNALGGMIDFLIALIFAIYVLLSKETLSRQIICLFQAFLPEKIRNGVLHVASTAHGIFCSFVTGQCIEAVILGSLCAVGMLIFRFPYAAMIGVLVGVTALIPVAGAFIGAGVGAFLILINDPFQALMFIVFIVVLQQIEGNVIYPKVVGSSVGLPAMWVLAAVTVGGGIGGIIGMLFAVPTVSVVYTLLREATRKRLEKKRKAAEDFAG